MPAAIEGDRAAVDELNARAWEFRTTSARRTFDLATEALAMASAIGYREGLAAGHRTLAWALILLGNHVDARRHIDDALALFMELEDVRGEIVMMNLRGLVHRRVGEPDESMEWYLRSLEMSRGEGFKRGESTALNGLGHLHNLTGDYERALECHTESLEVARAGKEPGEEASALLGIGNTHEKLCNYDEAIDNYRGCLKIAESINHRQLQVYASGNIAIIHQRRGDNATALRYELQCLRGKEEMDDRWGIGVSLNNIGIIYRSLGEYASAIETHVRSLEITQEIGDRQGESVALNNIGLTYEALGDRTRVLDYYLKSLRISEELGHNQGEAFSLGHIGRFYEGIGDGARALLYYFKSLRMHEGTGDRYGQINALDNIGSAFLLLRDYDRTAEYYGRSLTIAREIGDRTGELEALASLGELHIATGSFPAAIEDLLAGLKLAREIEHRDFERKTLNLLAAASEGAGDPVASAEYRRCFQECTRTIFNEQATQRVRELIYDFEGSHARRQGELLGLGEEDLTEVSAAIRKGVQMNVASGGADIDAPLAGRSHPVMREEARSVPSVEVRTFGEFHVTIGGRRLAKGDWSRKRARDLFKLLLINHRRALTLDEIAEHLWGGARDKNIDLLVMNAVSHIRKALDPERSPHRAGSALSSSDRSYMLDLGDDATIDFLRFKEMIVAARRSVTAEERHHHYEAAVNLYHGDFLKEDYYEDWTMPERDLLKDAFLEALEYMAGEHLRNRRLEQSMELARRILSHDTTSERGYEVLLMALRDRGRAGEARKMFGECVKIFRTEFGVDPPERLSRIVGS
jgi:DNA-binding SARP family transcriptional activator